MALVAALVSPLSASAVTTAKHEISANWVGNPAAAPFGSAVISEWHINTNDANDPEANDPVNNVRLTLTATNAVFASIPAVCKTTGVTPVSSISPNGSTLVCNLGTINEGTATVVQAPVRVSGQNGGNLSVSGTVTSDSATAPAGPASPGPSLPITYTHGMDLSLSFAPGAGYQGGPATSRTGGVRTFLLMNFSLILSAGSRPGPSTYSFPVNVSASVPAEMAGLQWEGCVPVSTASASSEQPFSDPAQTDRTNFPTCAIAGAGANYTVTVSNLNYTLVNTPTKDSLGGALPGTGAYIASGTIEFSIPSTVAALTTFTFDATGAGPFTFADGTVVADVPGDNTSTATLTPPGVFSDVWLGTPTYSRSPWDANLWVSPGTSQGVPLPTPGINTIADYYAAIAAGTPPLILPLYMQANSLAWQMYGGPGGAQMAGVCTMSQNANFIVTSMDGGGFDSTGYVNYSTARYFYTTAALNTKTETCGEPSPGPMWTEVTPPAGTTLKDPRIAGDSLIALPPGVTAVKMTWNPAVDRAPAGSGETFLRAFGYISPTSPTSGEGWTAGTFNFPGANPWPAYPNLNGYVNISTAPGGTNLPGSTYGPNMNGIRDAFRLQGPQGLVTKAASDTTARPGVPVTYTIQAEAQNSATNPPPAAFSVVDTLPAGMTYVPGSASPVPSSVVGQTITWTFTNVPANVFQTITYQAQTPANSTVAPGSSLTNTVQINVTGDQRPATTAGRQASATVTVPGSSATTLTKSVESNLLSFYGDSSAWDLTINSFDPISNPYTDTIDILPNVADGRGTNISGAYTITGVTAPAGSTVYYSSAPIASLSNDPRAASNGGTPGSIAGNTVGWSTTAVAHPTAIRVIGPALAPGAAQTIRIAFTTPAGTSCTMPSATDNKPGQKLVNSADTITGHTALPMLSSATTTIGTCYALGITKYVLAKGGNPANPADWHDANTPSDYQRYAVGDTIPYKIVVTNLGPGTLTNTVVTDALVPSCNVTIATLAAAASQTQQCSMTAAAVGTTVNTATASVSPPTGPTLTPSDIAGVVVAQPTITVQKLVAGRIATPDQFTVGLKDSGGTLLTSASTSGTGTSATTTSWPVTQGSTYTITDAMAAGSTSTISDYVPTIACTDTTTGTPVTVGGGVGAWTMTVSSTDAYTCKVTNSPGPPVTCTSSSNIFNTGYNAATGGVLPDNSKDAHWQVAGPFGPTTPVTVVSLPPANASFAPANVGNLAPGAWVPSPYGNAQWISQQTIANPTSPTGDWYYRYQFTLDPAVDPANVALSVNFLADNSVAEVYVNGIAQSSQTTGLPQAPPSQNPYFYAGFQAANAAATTLNHNWQSGLNTIIVQIKSGLPAEGFDAQVRPSALCPQPKVSIAKTADTTILSPGGTIHYTVTVSNTGLVPANNTPVSDPLPTGIASATWTCVGSGGATCAASGTGAINDTIATFPAGGVATYTITATVSASPPAHVTNTASATPPGGVCAPSNTSPPCTSIMVIPPVPQVSVVKTANTTTLTPSGTIIYTIVASNTGSVSAPNTTVSDPIPAGITGMTWTCAANGGAVCPNASGSGALNETVVTFPTGSSVTYTLTATVSANPPAHVTNTATMTPPSGGVCTPGNTSPPCTSIVVIPPVPQVSVVKTANTTTLTPSGTIIYTIVASNTGSVSAPNTTVSDPIPAGITGMTWTCAANGGAVCPNASGSGALNESVVTFPAGSSVTYTLTATVSANPPAHVTNTATMTPPSGVCTPGNTSPPCTSIVVIPPVPQVSVTKTANTTTLTPSGTIIYTIVASNTGSVNAPNTTVSDPIPTGITGMAWTCTASGGAVCPNASGSGALNETVVTFPAGSSVTYTLTATVSANPPAQVTNTATMTPPSGGVCTPGNTSPPCTSIVVIPPVPQVSVTKTANTTTLTPGGTIVYTVTARNTGSVAAPNTTVSDPIPTGITGYAWTCSATGGAVCPNASGSGALNETIATFPAGSTVTYTITATVSTNPPAQVTNTATMTPPSGGVCTPGNTSPPCTSIVVIPPVPQVSVTKTANTTTLTPGGTIVYTVTARNTGSVAAPNTTVSDPIPTGITGYAWTCSATGGAVCPNASGSGALNETIATFPAGSTATYTITATVSTNPPAQVTNTATMTPPSGGVCTPGNTSPPCTSIVTIPPVPQVSVTKTANTTTLTPGGTIVYTVTARNTGSVAAPNTVVSDPIPAGITGYAWTCAASGGAVCPNVSGSGALNETIATFPAGSTVTYTLTATVSANPPAQVTNTATMTPPSGGLCTPGNTSPPCTSIVVIPPVPQVSVVKTANTTTLTPGGTITYTIVAHNTGSVADPNTTVSDPIPAGITGYTWTCAATGGAVCPNASGSGALNETIATFPAGSTVTYTLTATVSANPPAQVTNTATMTPPSGGVCTPGNTSPPCTSIVIIPPVPQVSVTKTANTTTLTPGGTIVYTVTARNTGSVAAPNTTVSDPIPTGITGYAWTCAATGGAMCPNASGSGALNETIATFPAGSTVTYTVTATVSANPPATVSNTASITPPTGLCEPSNTPPPCSSTVIVPPTPQVSVTKTSNTTTLAPGGTIVYTVTARNTGSVAAPNTVVNDPIPTGITGYTWTCAATGGAACPNASGGGALNETIATFPASSTVTYTVTATVSANPPATVTNTASATPPGGVCAPGNTSPPCTSTVTVPPIPQVSIAKTANTTTPTPGGTIVYTVTASNTGTVAAPNTVVSDPIPMGITGYTWTCAAAGGAVCPNASGSGAISETIATFPVGGRVTYTVTATMSANPPPTITNTAGVTPSGRGLCAPGNTPPPCVSTVVVTVTVPGTPPEPTPVNSLWALLLLSLGMLGLTWRSRPRID
ncbi:DUF7507 domain-containing protein [Dokdonella soli]|uniref:DUF11 domain-containing protein n=1 Tax=Dokdonella soli TaxID=529810 RepID=A0ABP3U5D5_9GAMM